jgi:GDPmannose 4,6-dehydratase
MQEVGKIALITGITGQDVAYLAVLLLGKGYVAHGVKRRSSLLNTDRNDDLYQVPHVYDQRLVAHQGDMVDSTNLIRILQQVKPDEIYNVAAMSHQAVSFETPEYAANGDGIGTLRILKAIRVQDLEKTARVYNRTPRHLTLAYVSSMEFNKAQSAYVGIYQTSNSSILINQKECLTCQSLQ